MVPLYYDLSEKDLLFHQHHRMCYIRVILVTLCNTWVGVAYQFIAYQIKVYQNLFLWYLFVFCMAKISAILYMSVCEMIVQYCRLTPLHVSGLL